MDAEKVIESYVGDVTRRLARRERADVAVELRALLSEELADRAEEAGRPADVRMAADLLASFGPPSQVALRYRPADALIDPADTRPFLAAAFAGSLALIAIIVAQPHASRDTISEAVLSWLGLLLVVFAAHAWARRRWPGYGAWKARDPDRASRLGNLALAAIIVIGMVAYGAPTWVYAQVTGGARLAPWLARLNYAPGFQATQLPWLLTLWGGQALLAGWLAFAGRWSPSTRRLEAGLALAVSAVLAWFVVAGPMFQTPEVEHIARAWLAVITVGVFVDAGVKVSRLIRPSPPTPRRGPSTLPA